jgi:hypothetical protein
MQAHEVGIQVRVPQQVIVYIVILVLVLVGA